LVIKDYKCDKIIKMISMEYDIALLLTFAYAIDPVYIAFIISSFIKKIS